MAPWVLIEKLRKESKNVTLIHHEKRREIYSARFNFYARLRHSIVTAARL